MLGIKRGEDHMTSNSEWVQRVARGQALNMLRKLMHQFECGCVYALPHNSSSTLGYSNDDVGYWVNPRRSDVRFLSYCDEHITEKERGYI